MYLIVEISEAASWAPHFSTEGRRIPENRRPTVIQPDLKTAEAEAKRLACAHQGGVFMIFKAVAAGTTVKVPSHINIEGKVLRERTAAAIVEVDDPEELPF